MIEPVRALFLEETDHTRCTREMRTGCKELALVALNSMVHLLQLEGGENTLDFVTVSSVLKKMKMRNVRPSEYKCLTDSVEMILQWVYPNVKAYTTLFGLNQYVTGTPDPLGGGFSLVYNAGFEKYWKSTRKVGLYDTTDVCEGYFFYKAAIIPEIVGQPFSSIIVRTGFHPSFKSKEQVVVPKRSVAMGVVSAVRNALTGGATGTIVVEKRRTESEQSADLLNEGKSDRSSDVDCIRDQSEELITERRPTLLQENSCIENNSSAVESQEVRSNPRDVVLDYSATVLKIRPVFLEAQDSKRCSRVLQQLDCRKSLGTALNVLLEMLNTDSYPSGLITAGGVLHVAGIRSRDPDYKCVWSRLGSVLRRVYLEEEHFYALMDFNQSVELHSNGGRRRESMTLDSFWGSQQKQGRVRGSFCEPYFFYMAAIIPEMVDRPFSDIILRSTRYRVGTNIKHVVVPVLTVAIAIVSRAQQILDMDNDTSSQRTTSVVATKTKNNESDVPANDSSRKRKLDTDLWTVATDDLNDEKNLEGIPFPLPPDLEQRTESDQDSEVSLDTFSYWLGDM